MTSPDVAALPLSWRLEAVPSDRTMDRAAYMTSLRDGTNTLPSRFARKHYGS